MKEKSPSLYLSAAASIFAASTLAWAQPATTGSAASDSQRGAASTAAPSTSSPATTGASDNRSWEREHRASKIIGTDVRNRQGEKVGDIKDLIIDRNGAISLAIVSTGGFLGIGDRLHAVPWSALQTSSGKDRLLDIDKARLKEAPGFDSRSWPNLGDERWLNENRRYFGSTSSTAPTSASGRSGGTSGTSGGSSGSSGSTTR